MPFVISYIYNPKNEHEQHLPGISRQVDGRLCLDSLSAVVKKASIVVDQ